jgi:GAF domain-containing protein
MPSNFPPKQSDSLPTMLVNWLTAPSTRIIDLTAKRQARLAATLALVLMFFFTMGGIASGRNNAQAALPSFGIPVAILTVAYLITRTRFSSFGSFLFVSGMCASGYISIILGKREVPINVLLYVPLALTIGSALLSSWALFLLTGLNVGAIFLLPKFGAVLSDNTAGALAIVTVFGIVLIVLNNFRQNIERERITELERSNRALEDVRTNLETRVEERTEELNRRSLQLEASAQVARSAASVHSLHDLLDNVVNQISERFGYDHTGLFFVDSSGRFLVMQATSSEGGKRLQERNFKLEIGRQGLVGYAAYQKRPRIVQDVTEDSAFIRVAELAETRSEVALPLIVRDQLIGVLDIQSNAKNAFSIDAVSNLQTMADQIALAIDNTILLEESQAAIQQLEVLNISNATKSWKTRAVEKKGYSYTPLGVVPLAETKNIPALSPDKTINIPLNLRGKTIGTISLKRKASDPAWVDTEKDLAQRIAAQVVLAVENARLLEESQRRAAREQTVNEFSNRFSRSLDVDALLQNAVRELQQRLPQAADVSVFINPENDAEKAK